MKKGRLIWHNIPTRRGRTILVLVSSISILAIGISRIYLGVHYPSDIIDIFLLVVYGLHFLFGFINVIKKSILNKNRKAKVITSKRVERNLSSYLKPSLNSFSSPI
ncbi:phosphatase PAP2 family protein [Priestia megaterium]|uniref:phosphatase PAP2 family protein n=1 Tax=Priestia megaterium TaxID=1404 RepID=UPI00366E0C97